MFLDTLTNLVAGLFTGKDKLAHDRFGLIGIVAGLLGSRLGRWAALALLGAATVTLILWRVFAAGRAGVAAQQTQETLTHVLDIVRRDNALRSLSPAARREWLRRYAEGRERR